MSTRSIAAPKVVFLAGRDPTEEIGGGHSSYVRATAQAATALGCDVHIYCASGRSGNQLLDYGLVRRVPHRGRPCRQTQVAFHSPALIAAATDAMDPAAPPVLIHSFGVWGHVGHGLRTRWLAAGLFVPHLISMYTVYEEEALALLRASAAYGRLQHLRQWLGWRWVRSRITPLEREALLGADAVAVNYDSVRALLAKHHGVGHKVERIGYSPESAFLSESEIGGASATPALGLDDGRPLIIAITLQRPKKGVDKFLHALSLLKQRGVGFRACVVGGGPLLAAHRRLAHTLKLTDRVVFAGLVPDVRPYLRVADIFVLPSLREESGSLALLEAMQAGCAIVASGIDGVLEDVRHGEDGLLVEPGDTAGLAAAIESLLNDPAQRSRIGSAARRTFEQRFSADAHRRELGRIYHRLGVPAGSNILPSAIPSVRS
ncbi:MAG: glycosyltransferase family 4 protein [Planctomycetota bacterium]